MVDRAVEDRRRCQALDAQADDERVGLPVTARRVVPEARAPRAPPVASEQVGRDAALVQKDVLADVTERHPLAPVLARDDDIRPTLLVGVHRFF